MSYPFLSQPPPQKSRPILPPPGIPASPCPPIRRRSATVSAISAWAAQIQPGSPAPLSPCSQRRPSFSSPRSARRPSFSRPPSNFLSLVDTPTTASTLRSRSYTRSPSLRDIKAGLASQGYASVFVHLPPSPCDAKSVVFPASPFPPAPPAPAPQKKRSLSRLRSLSMLSRISTNASAQSGTTTKSGLRIKAKPKKKAESTGRSRYAHLRALPLAAEVQLSQLLDGGSHACNTHRVAEAHARSAGLPNGAPGAGVSGMWRDAAGGLWWDEDEEWEITNLLAGADAAPAAARKGADEWVEFPAGEERRGSVSSTESRDTDADVDPRYAMRPTAAAAAAPRVRRTDQETLDAFTVRAATAAPSAAGTSVRAKCSAQPRRRPAPLTLALPSPPMRRPSNSPRTPRTRAPVPATPPAVVARGDFLADSFAPPPAPPIMVKPSRRPGTADPSASTLSLASSTASRRFKGAISRLTGKKA